MRILVAGWHGQISLALSEAAAVRQDVRAYAVGRPALDLADRPAIGRTLLGLKPDIIINTAGYTHVHAAKWEPDAAYRGNVAGAAALAAQAARLNVPIIHLSTVHVFDGRASRPYREDDRTSPLSAYGRSKADGEIAVAAANPRHIILRTGWVYSPFGRNFVTGILAQRTKHSMIHVDTLQHGSPTYAPHLAAAVLDIAAQAIDPLAASDPNRWGIFHIADAGSSRWYDLAKATLAHADNASPHAGMLAEKGQDQHDDCAQRPQNAELDTSKLQLTFGIQLPHWQSAVRNCVDRAYGQ